MAGIPNDKNDPTMTDPAGPSFDSLDSGQLGPSTRGRLLVAAPPLGDPNFDRSVVFMIEHDEGGAFGVVINRPNQDLPFEAMTGELDSWRDLVAPPSRIFRGGPVQTASLIALARVEIGDEPRVQPVDLDIEPIDHDDRPTALRVFHGYAGWGPQQLDGELALGAWIVVDALADDVFDADPGGLWRRVLRRQPDPVCWLADVPEDPSAN